MKKVRIGGASSHIVDSTLAVAQLLSAEPAPDYLMFDFLAEGSIGMLAEARRASADGGYVVDFIRFHLAPNLSAIRAKGVRLIANAGGLNVRACAAAVESFLREQGVELTVGFVEGDDLLEQVDSLRASGVRDMYSAEPFPDSLESLNAYLGAAPIAGALDAGADIVIVGRCADSALALGALLHEFGWDLQDWDRLAAGTLAGHLIECGCQVTGGTFTDWEAVPDWANIGYPIAEVAADGSCIITKPDGSGGLVSEATVAEQLLYEVSDPQAYIVPDVVCDFSAVQIRQVAENRVEVTGARGLAATDSYKAIGSIFCGWRSAFSQVVLGIDAVRKAERQGMALVERSRQILAAHSMGDFSRSCVEAIGGECSYGPASRARQSREVFMRVSVEHPERAAVELFLREAPVTSSSMAVGSAATITTGMSAIYHLFMFLLPKDRVSVKVTVDGKTAAIASAAGRCFDPQTIRRPSVAHAAIHGQLMVEVPLISLAWARSGDKGNLFNIGVIARKPEYLPHIRASLSEDRVGRLYGHLCSQGGQPPVICYEVPGCSALNFVVSDSLDGGIAVSPRVDSAAKGMAQQLLQISVRLPASLVPPAGG